MSERYDLRMGKLYETAEARKKRQMSKALRVNLVLRMPCIRCGVIWRVDHKDHGWITLDRKQNPGAIQCADRPACDQRLRLRFGLPPKSFEEIG